MARIILIDDNEPLRRALQRVLERGGHQVQAAEDGKQGLRLFEEHGADLVITDLVMPNAEGIETIRELVRLSPGLKILAISGGVPGTSLDMLAIAEKLGATSTMRKPVATEALLTRIAELLDPPPA